MAEDVSTSPKTFNSKNRNEFGAVSRKRIFFFDKVEDIIDCCILSRHIEIMNARYSAKRTAEVTSQFVIITPKCITQKCLNKKSAAD